MSANVSLFTSLGIDVIVEMAYALSGVRQAKTTKAKEPQKGAGLFGRIMGNVNEQAEVRVE